MAVKARRVYIKMDEFLHYKPSDIIAVLDKEQSHIALKYSAVSNWLQRFEGCNDSAKDDPKTWRPA